MYVNKKLRVDLQSRKRCNNKRDGKRIVLTLLANLKENNNIWVPKYLLFTT